MPSANDVPFRAHEKIIKHLGLVGVRSSIREARLLFCKEKKNV